MNSPDRDSSSAEDLDEDRLRADPLEAGMDPPEHWSGADKYGTTPYEQSHPRPMEDRLAEEQPETQPEPSPLDEKIEREAVDRGQAADEAGGSMAAEERTPLRPAE